MIGYHRIISSAYSLGERVWHMKTSAALNGDQTVLVDDEQIVIFR